MRPPVKLSHGLGLIGAVLLVAGCGQGGRVAGDDTAPPEGDADRLSQSTAAADIASARGGGVFGQWVVDDFGLPAYDYTLDQVADPRAARVELGGLTDAWHQVGNDAMIANAYNHGYVQLWNQARLSQWVNNYNEASRHYAGGYGYLHEDGEVVSTLWLDRPGGSAALRRFGVGYFERRLIANQLVIADTVTAPWGESPALVHTVTLTNTGDRERRLSWWEYWDVNPVDRTLKRTIGYASPHFDAERGLLQVAQLADGIDPDPQTIFLAALDTPVDGFETAIDSFFGAGTRAAPAAVAADTASGSIALPYPGSTTQQHLGPALFALRTPVTLGPGESVTLRYVYGIADADDIGTHIAQARARPDVRAATAQAWRDWLPQIDLGEPWLNRELVWDAYMTRSASQWEEVCGHHVITQGGYYQYGTGLQIAFRDPLQHMLPLIYAEPELARETLRYSFQQQPPVLGPMSYGMGPLCTRIEFGSSNDLDFWLLLALTEYVLATRDLAFLAEDLPYRGGLPTPALLSGTVWEHAKLAYRHQEEYTPRGLNGHYVVGATGDWSDFSPQFLQMTESVLVTAQLAYLYPRLAELAELAGDPAFAATVRGRAGELLESLRGEWTGLGWYARGYSALTQLGQGAIFGEPQPWALLAGAADPAQAATLVGNIRRFLTGINAPPEVMGPAVIGSSMSPAANDPEVTETSFPPPEDVGDNNAVFVGGVWYAINGPLVWALGELDGIVPDAAAHAWDEFRRNTLAAHAEAFPDYWDGVLNVDDACWPHFSSDPGRCAITSVVTLGGSVTAGQITHQPAWSWFALLKLAGIAPGRDGFRIAPRLPLQDWSIRLPHIGLEQTDSGLRGYFKLVGDGPVTLEVLPRGAPATAAWTVTVDGEPVAAQPLAGGGVRFTVAARGGRVFDWSVSR